MFAPSASSRLFPDYVHTLVMVLLTETSGVLRIISISKPPQINMTAGRYGVLKISIFDRAHVLQQAQAAR